MDLLRRVLMRHSKMFFRLGIWAAYLLFAVVLAVPIWLLYSSIFQSIRLENVIFVVAVIAIVYLSARET